MIVGKWENNAAHSLQLLMWRLEPADQYLKSFHWNKVKYRADKPLGDIVVTLQKVLANTEATNGPMSNAESSFRRSPALTTMLRTSTTSIIRSRPPSPHFKESRGKAPLSVSTQLKTDNFLQWQPFQ